MLPFYSLFLLMFFVLNVCVCICIVSKKKAKPMPTKFQRSSNLSIDSSVIAKKLVNKI